jgi:hypothetical protein
MIPNGAFGKLLLRVNDSAAMKLSTIALGHVPRLFGICDSVFAARVQDIPLLLIDIAPLVASDALDMREAMFSLLDEALREVPEATLIKTDGDRVMLVDDRSHDMCEKAMSLMLLLARLLYDSRMRGPHRRSPLRYSLVAGPLMGAVLGTAALSFEYYGAAVATADALLRQVVGGCVVGQFGAASSRFVQLIEWWILFGASSRFTICDANRLKEEMRCGFDLSVPTAVRGGVAVFRFACHGEWRVTGSKAKDRVHHVSATFFGTNDGVTP